MTKLLMGIALLLAVNLSMAQQNCNTAEYQHQLIQKNPSLATVYQSVENFIAQHPASSSSLTSTTSRENGAQPIVIKIPVVVHIMYHYPEDNISDSRIISQIANMNRDFRKRNADTSNIPSYFKSLAADVEIEFELAKVDPHGVATTGIIHKYSPIATWSPDDKVKSSAEMGDDGWDPKSYLNIWVCEIAQVLGYSSFPGDAPEKDGIVLAYRALGGRVIVHETGHWLGLRHLWGDTNCGDDGVADTPQQQTFTNGCPTGIRLSCNKGNAPNGDLYMDFMDFTSDACRVMFTAGQKQRMRSLFEPGGPRHSILYSNALGMPTVSNIPLPDAPPQWLQFRVYPNPVSSTMNINVDYDARWVGKEISIINVTGAIQMKAVITSKTIQLDVSRLKPGVYFLKAEKEGEKVMQKFVKL